MGEMYVVKPADATRELIPLEVTIDGNAAYS